MPIPSVYAAGYEKARSIDAVLAGSYVALTRVGDPPVDAVMSDLEPMGHAEAARLLGGAIEQNEQVLRDAPASLQGLIHEVSTVPVWYDRQAAQCGCRAFFKNSDDILAAYLAGAIVEGFSTMISKSFAITGRVIDNGVRRLKQNVRHLVNIFMPRGVEPSQTAGSSRYGQTGACASSLAVQELAGMEPGCLGRSDMRCPYRLGFGRFLCADD